MGNSAKLRKRVSRDGPNLHKESEERRGEHEQEDDAREIALFVLRILRIVSDILQLSKL